MLQEGAHGQNKAAEVAAAQPARGHQAEPEPGRNRGAPIARLAGSCCFTGDADTQIVGGQSNPMVCCTA